VLAVPLDMVGSVLIRLSLEFRPKNQGKFLIQVMLKIEIYTPYCKNSKVVYFICSTASNIFILGNLVNIVNTSFVRGNHKNDNYFQHKSNSNLTGSYKGRVKVILNK